MKEWRSDGPLGVLLAVINYIKTPQQYELFTSFQQLAHKELPPSATEDDAKYLSLSSQLSLAGIPSTHVLSALPNFNPL